MYAKTFLSCNIFFNKIKIQQKQNIHLIKVETIKQTQQWLLSIEAYKLITAKQTDSTQTNSLQTKIIARIQQRNKIAHKPIATNQTQKFAKYNAKRIKYNSIMYTTLNRANVMLD